VVPIRNGKLAELFAIDPRGGTRDTRLCRSSPSTPHTGRRRSRLADILRRERGLRLAESAACHATATDTEDTLRDM
jgi:hypothetical protein